MLRVAKLDSNYTIPNWYFRKKLRKHMTDDMYTVLFSEMLIAGMYVAPFWYKDAVEVIDGKTLHPLPFRSDRIDEYEFWGFVEQFGMSIKGFAYAVSKRLERNIHPEKTEVWLRVQCIVHEQLKSLGIYI